MDRQKLASALRVNEDIKIEKIDYGDFSYLRIKNFLKNPEGAIEFLSKYPAITQFAGAKQSFTPLDLVPLLKTYKSIMATVNVEIEPMGFITTSNIHWKGINLPTNSEGGRWWPHTDTEVVCNLWLCDYEGGTAFYKYKGFSNVKDIEAPSFRNSKQSVPWQNFEGDDDWELYYIIPSQFNTLAIYDGTNFHSAYADFNDEYRYSLVSFYWPDRKFSYNPRRDSHLLDSKISV